MATIKDIADEAGISIAAVSRILNNKGSFNAETIAKVERIARRLNYKPISVLQQEDKQNNKIIAAIFPSVEIPYFGLLTSLLEKYAYDYGYQLMLCGSLFDRCKEEECFKKLKDGKLSGVLLGSYTFDAVAIENEKLPIVTIGYKLCNSIPSISTDNFSAGRIAARHLLSKGCKKFLYITSYLGDTSLDLRYQGFKSELSGFDIHTYTVSMEMQIENDFSSIITKMALQNPNADAIFAETDALAMNCIQVYSELGYKIPEDVKIIGYGYPFFSAFSNPKLTLIKENTKELTKTAVDILVDMIENEGVRYENRDIIIPVSLAEHKTT